MTEQELQQMVGSTATGLLETAKVVPCKRSNYGGKREASAIKYLVFHYTGNDGDRAENNALYYQNTTVQASAHYFVDDDSVYLSVDPLYVAWAVGGSKWKDCPQTGGGKAYGVVRNANSISIEMCDTYWDGKIMATEATLARAAQLGREIMAKYHIPIENVVRHFDVTGKHCPAYFMDEDAWAAFKARLTDKPQEQAPWYAENWARATELGLVDGTRPEDPVTRAECVTIVLRALTAQKGEK